MEADKKAAMMEKIYKVIGTIIGIIIIVLFIAYIGDCSGKRPWKGTLTHGEESETATVDFEALEDCRAWAVEQADKGGWEEGEWDYECGRDCEYAGTGGPGVSEYECAEIAK